MLAIMTGNYMGLVARKPDFGGGGGGGGGGGSCAGWFESHLFGYPKDKFCRVEANIAIELPLMTVVII